MGALLLLNLPEPDAVVVHVHTRAHGSLGILSRRDLDARINQGDVCADDVFWFPGMPEWGMLPIPKYLLEQGVRDMVRISDARMSGTSYGTCVLHVSPESASGGPLALVRSGDMIELDVENRLIHLDVSSDELNERRSSWTEPPTPYQRGFGKLFCEEITQAHEGCDFRFLHSGAPTPEPKIH